MVERKFETKIKVVQSDGGMKFHFLTKLGFVGLQHKIIYPYTSFQNNVMEPRNHKVLKKGLAFLVHYGMPRRYWIYALRTLVFVLNKIYFKSDKRLIPYEILYHK